ncbi:MAG TPA: DNA gyrase subunit A, partial [Agromyces sp.]|nr:DNA gyrase subunit A [Agromyces sp.]
INNVALVDGGPQTLGLRELLQVYVAHRISVVTRRSEFRLARKRERLHLVDGLLIAILDIDEVIQLIRSSDDTAAARARLIEVFDLSQVQADYILELQLRRLTKFSRIELETERDRLRAEIAELEALLSSRHRIEALVSDELAEVAERFGTHRRTLLTDARPSIAGAAAKRAAAVLEVADVPCRVFLSATGRIARVDLPVGEDGAPAISVPARRSKHDAIRSTLDTTSRAEIGAVTSLGRLIRFTPVDLPMLPPTSVQLGAGVKISDYLALPNRDEKVLAIVSLDSDRSIALGTKQGIVKRVATGGYPNRPEFEVIGLKVGDEVVGAVQGDESDELVFVASDAQLLRFPASSVRPQGCPAGGMAGINLGSGAHAIHFAGVPADAASDVEVVTLAASSDTLLGTDPGSAKVSDFAEFPAKGRATGGVRAQRFLKGEDALHLAWVGRSPALAVGSDGSARTLPDGGAKRDGSGQPLEAVVGAIGHRIG